ncbi:MAG: sulfatase-like hydrolase/transferase, partial [Endomicrobium sp.]|nr:sulfatase-like hydrolase/transferase [Endomicrobium sp.]
MVLIFSLFRLLFCVVYADAFAGLSFLDKAVSFVYGLRFDLAMISLFLGGFIIILFLPISKKQIFIKICATMMCVSMLTMLLGLTADFFYFPEVKRHMTEDVILAFRDKDFIIKYVLRYYWWALGLILVLLIFTITKSFRSIDKNYNPKPVSLHRSAGFFIVVVLIVLFGRRENLSGMPLNLIDAYKISRKQENIQLILNGIFTQYYFLKGTNDTKGLINSNYPMKQALKNTRKILLNKNEIFVDEKYPIMRCLKIVEKKSNYNIVVFLLESWTPQYIDSFNGNVGYGVTPVFDKIADNGIKFVNAYSAGPRSQFGLISSLVGMQIVPGTVHYYGFDFMSHFTKIASAFKKRGYNTTYAQSSERKSIMMCSVAENMLGFDVSYGKEDFPRLMDYKYDTTYDYDMLDFVSKKAFASHKQGKPFFLYAFTGTTHIPFIQTTQEFEKYPPTSNENKYLNNLCYADYSIGHFIEQAKRDGYFDNTIFIFMADHIAGNFAETYRDTKKRFKIPMVIYAPKIFSPKVVKYTVSQSDLIPTLYHLMDIDEPFSAIGVNALDENADHFALIVDGMNLVFVDKRGDYLASNRLNVVESSVDKNSDKYNSLNKMLLSLDRSITELIKINRWYKS